jgi:hypothetical protein
MLWASSYETVYSGREYYRFGEGQCFHVYDIQSCHLDIRVVEENTASIMGPFNSKDWVPMPIWCLLTTLHDIILWEQKDKS